MEDSDPEELTSRGSEAGTEEILPAKPKPLSPEEAEDAASLPEAGSPPQSPNDAQRKSATAKKPLHKKDGPPRTKKKTQAEKRARQSGKNTEKPYISSSLGDMCRHMIRMACTENTLNMTEPPPVEFYDYWHKFKLSEANKDRLPYQLVDTRKVSVPRLKMNTSSFDIMAKKLGSSPSLHIIDAGDRRPDAYHKLAPTLDELWKNVRISMSSESFISSSTKNSETQDLVPLECGWSSDDDDDLQALLSDEDDESATTVGPEYGEGRASGIARPSAEAVHPKGAQTSQHSGGEGEGKDGEKKELGAMAGSLLRLGMEDARVAWAHAVHLGKFAGSDVVDYFMQDLDDSFLIDAISYGMLPDSAFIPEFDYFNEDPIYRARELERERLEYEATLTKKGRKRAAEEAARNAAKPRGKLRTLSDVTLAESEAETEFCPEPKSVKEGIVVERDDYKTCMEKQKKRIEDMLRAAVKCRTAMGAYIVPPGEKPLAETFADAGPGPAAYTPNVNAIKPSPVGVFLAKRWSDNIYEKPGPGPAAYFPNCHKCTGEMLNRHFAPRFEKSETLGPGPGQYDTLKNTTAGKDKPHARIISRLPPQKVGCGGSRYVNIFGFNQFGKRHPPSAIMISRHYLKDRSEVTQRPGVGPGSYDSPVFKDTRIGITLKSRIPRIGEDDDSPNFVKLPPLIGQGPKVTLGSRKFTNIEPCSPGPIYSVRPPPPKPVSMTFKPFPSLGDKDEPSPIQYGTAPGDQGIKVKPRAPNPLIFGPHKFDHDNGIPGPYSIQENNRLKGITLVGRPKTKIDTSPGPYGIGGCVCRRNGPRAVFQGKWHVKEIPEPPKCDYIPTKKSFNPADPCTLEFITPKDVTHRVTGGLMSARWPSKDEDDEEPGPRFNNVFGCTNRGKYSKIPVSLKSRQSPFVYTHMSKVPESLNQKDCDISQKAKNDKPC